MISQKIHIKQVKSLPLRKKIMSQLIFPIDSNFCLRKSKNEKQSENHEFNMFNQMVTSTLDFENSNKSSRIQTYPFLCDFSQKKQKNETSTVSRSKNCSYGAFLHPLSNRHATVYKKKVLSQDVGNINQLNITSYRSFKIRSPIKKLKNMKGEVKDSKIEMKILGQERSANIGMGKIGFRKRQVERELPSTLKNVKIKLQNSYNTLQIMPRTLKQVDEHFMARERKNSICPWEDIRVDNIQQ